MRRSEMEVAIEALPSSIEPGAPRSVSDIYWHAEVNAVCDLLVELGLVEADA